jgi:small subunit ribosomal protein S4e
MSKHLHRLAAPRNYPILRRIKHYIIKVGPGPHPKKASLPLLLVLRDMLKIADTQDEIRHILNDKKIIVDEKIRRNPKFPVGFMDTISFLHHHYRLLFKHDGTIDLTKITDEEAKTKLCKIVDKTIIRKGKTQLNLHDGRNIIVNDGKYKAGDSIMITLPDQKITKHFPLEKHMLVYIIDGKHIGETAKLVDFHSMSGSTEDRVVLDRAGEKFETLKKYVFVIGKEKPEIHIGEH